MVIVPTVSTPISAEHARDALLAASPGLDRESAALLLALIWIETGRGHLLNHNAGNITASASWPGAAWRPPWFSPEQTDPRMAALHEKMIAGQAPSAFRAYNSASEGFADFVRVLKSQFKSVLEAAASGDPADFVKALHDSRYSTDYNASHIGPIASLRDLFVPLVAHLPASSSAGAGVGLAVVAALGLYLLTRKRRPARAPRIRKGNAWRSRRFRQI